MEGQEEEGTEVLEEVPVSEDWGGGGESCLEDLAGAGNLEEVEQEAEEEDFFDVS